MTDVFDLDHQHGSPEAQLRELVGGKAANLGIMVTELGLPVPPGFVISTRACRAYLAGGWPDGLDDEIDEHLAAMETALGRRLGDPADPLLVSVRSGAPVSMPGMMDTILNLGMNAGSEHGLARASGDADFARNCHERFRAMYRHVVGRDAPEDPREQLRGAIEVVFRSWNSDRARAYRAVEGIPDDLGTAVTVQAMVFGNRGSDSATGVLFTRDPSTGERVLFGDLLFDAQGEDVVAGTHRTQPIAALGERLPAVGAELARHAEVLERRYTDLCDIEFTVESGRLWMLQVRVGKRSPQAALRMAVEMAQDADFPLTREQAVHRVAGLLADPPRRAAAPSAGTPAVATGLPASPGVAGGEIVLSTEAAVELAAAGRPYILVRAETSPEDVPAMATAAGVLTTLGGLASHAAVVARGWGVPAVVGASDVRIDGEVVHLGTDRLSVGDLITLDGSTGRVYLGAVAGADGVLPEVALLQDWASELGVEIPPSAQGSGDQDGSDAETSGVTARPVTADDVVRLLSIKGISAPDGIATGLLAPLEDVTGVLAGLEDAGVVVRSRSGVRLTPAGTDRAQELLEEDRRLLPDEEAGTALEDFAALDRRMKDVVTAWQVREGGAGAESTDQTLNDHSDAGYDAQVLGRLGEVHGDTHEWLLVLQPKVSRLGDYAQRLTLAIEAVRAGDHRYVASPRVDSFHGIWFELHEDLIRLAGRTRADEVAAGRA